jgi:hypothetical protein
MRTGKHVTISVMLICLLGSYQTASAGINEAPPQAQAVGYKLNTFSSTFREDLDLRDSRSRGYSWYLAKWFGWPSAQASTLKANGDGTLTLNTSDGKANYTMGSAAQSRLAYPNDWVGTAFGGGGYFEAELKFYPEKATSAGAIGFPAWWLDSLECLRADQGKAQWKGQPPGYQHCVEVDVFEYNQWKNPISYSGAIHEWYGINNVTCLKVCQVNNCSKRTRFNNFIIETPGNTDFHEYHRYGLLWVPATKKSQGYAEYYFDGKPTGDKVTWNQYNDESPPPGFAPWTFGVLDRQHLVLILGTGTNQPVTVKTVNVWQKSEMQNLSK